MTGALAIALERAYPPFDARTLSLERKRLLWRVIVAAAAALVLVSFVYYRLELTSSDSASAALPRPKREWVQAQSQEQVPVRDPVVDEVRKPVEQLVDHAAVAVEAPVPGAPAPTPSQFPSWGEHAWARKYANPGLDDLIAVEASMSKDLSSRTQPLLKERFDMGLGEYLGPGNTIEVTDHDPLEIYSYVIQPRGQGTYKVVLPQHLYPELNDLKTELVWVRNQIGDRRILALSAK
jgi:hypothetical protein